MKEDLIGYRKLTQNAMRDVVKQALLCAVKGLPGEHHFYISFRTRAKGVDISRVLLEKYPEEMTIVLQLQYEELEVSDEDFAVTLHFGGVPQRIKVAFTALTRFYDPYMSFALPFDYIEEEYEQVPLAEMNNGVAKEEKLAKDSSPSVVSLDAFRKK